MNLLALRTEILSHGFDPNQFSASRLNQYINDGLNLICRRVDYYTDEATFNIPTVAGTASYAWPTDFAKERSLFDTNRNLEMQSVALRDIDRSSTSSGAPYAYALDGQNVHLYPTPDGVYNLEMRYWKMPAQLSADTDVPSLPADYHKMLWVYGCAICYEAEDDTAGAQYWMGRFQNDLSMFAADAKFPNSDEPFQAKGMWEQSSELGQHGWSLYLGY